MSALFAWPPAIIAAGCRVFLDQTGGQHGLEELGRLCRRGVDTVRQGQHVAVAAQGGSGEDGVFQSG